jgi:hypothetical protein
MEALQQSVTQAAAVAPVANNGLVHSAVAQVRMGFVAGSGSSAFKGNAALVAKVAKSSGNNFPVSGSNKSIARLESLFYTDSGIPEEKIDRPTGLPKGLRAIGNNPRCPECKAKGVVECATCSGSGLYVDAVLESQGIIVKVRCLGCGGIGNHMCLQCGGRGHV